MLPKPTKLVLTDQQLTEVVDKIRVTMETHLDLEKSTPQAIWDVFFSTLKEKLSAEELLVVRADAVRQNAKTMAEICEQVAKICEPCQLRTTVGCDKADCIVNLRKFVWVGYLLKEAK